MVIAVVVSDDVALVVTAADFVTRMTNFNISKRTTAKIVKIIKEMQ
jgi:hypothetical protein